MTPTLATEDTFFGLSKEDITSLLAGEPRYRIDQIQRGRYAQGLFPWEVTSLPRKLRESLHETLAPRLALTEETIADGGRTIKALLRFADGATVETVLMQYRTRSTVCISSQAGCAMGCVFCATGQRGFGRHLTPGEMEEQYFWARRRLRTIDDSAVPTNVVMMGMGEPLANYDNTLRFIRTLNADYGLGARSITISTVGIVPGIERLTGEPMQVNLAVSLHAPTDELRSQIVPINQQYPIPRLLDALAAYTEKTHRRVSFEYAMMEGVNDSDEQARDLAQLANQIRAHINLIPLNATPGYATVGSSRTRIDAFVSILEERGVNATVRDTRGSDIAAACGQLAATAQSGGQIAAAPTLRLRHGRRVRDSFDQTI